MKKLLSTAVLVISITCGNSYAEVLPVADLVTETTTSKSAIENALTAASTELNEIETKTSNYFNRLSWVKQLKTMYDQLKGIYAAAEKLTSQITGYTDAAMGLATKFSSPSFGGQITSKTADYNYAPLTPSEYTPNFSCNLENGQCKTSNGGFEGAASGVNSTKIRDNLKIDQFKETSILNPTLTDKARYIQSAEQNAQEMAVIQAMAQEAYAQADIRIKNLEHLHQKISAEPDPKKNTLKRVADLQAEIQVQQGLLTNEQNKIASLAILQQSQRDMYEQRKKEIAANLYRDQSSNLAAFAVRGLITGANAGVLSYVASEFSTSPDAEVTPKAKTGIATFGGAMAGINALDKQLAENNQSVINSVNKKISDTQATSATKLEADKKYTKIIEDEYTKKAATNRSTTTSNTFPADYSYTTAALNKDQAAVGTDIGEPAWKTTYDTNKIETNGRSSTTRATKVTEWSKIIADNQLLVASQSSQLSAQQQRISDLDAQIIQMQAQLTAMQTQ